MILTINIKNLTFTLFENKVNVNNHNIYYKMIISKIVLSGRISLIKILII
jgi:hypothetical protein